jgi:hypothetical protein
VNLLIYLANQLLRGCQFADNQVQALQNQATEGFSVHGSWLSELEAEIVQIHIFFIVFALLLDFSGSVGFGTWRIFFPFFWATCRLFSIFLLFRISKRFLSVILYTLFTLVLLRHQAGVFYYCGLSIIYLPFVPLRQKLGV